MDLVRVLAIWAHTLAFVIAWGYYGILGRMVLPALIRSLDGEASTRALVEIERRALPLVVLSVGMFAVTGTYLLFTDPQYEGLGRFFASTWTTLMLAKHGLVIVLVAVGVAIDLLIRLSGEATTAPDRARAMTRIRLSTEIATGLGAGIALLTAAAQVAT